MWPLSAAALQEEEEKEDIALHPPPLLLTSPSFQRTWAGALASLAPFSPPFGLRREMEAAGRGHSGGLCNLRPIQNCVEKRVLMFPIRNVLCFFYKKSLRRSLSKPLFPKLFKLWGSKFFELMWEGKRRRRTNRKTFFFHHQTVFSKSRRRLPIGVKLFPNIGGFLREMLCKQVLKKGASPQASHGF